MKRSKGRSPKGTRRDKRFSTTVKAVEGGAREFTFVLSNGQVDRDHETVRVEGINLENYRRNPVVLWGHEYHELPIGTCTSIAVQGAELIGTARIVEREKYAFAGDVHDLLEDGVLRAVSIGFMVHDAVWNDVRGGWDLLETELVEWSVCSVPALPGALIQGRAAKSFGPIRRHALDTLEQLEPGGLWLSAEDAKAYRQRSEEPPPTPEPPVADPVEPPPVPADPAPEPTPVPVAAASAQDRPPLVVLRLNPPRPEERRIPVSRELVVAATQAAVSNLVGAQLRALTGRLD